MGQPRLLRDISAQAQSCVLGEWPLLADRSRSHRPLSGQSSDHASAIASISTLNPKCSGPVGTMVLAGRDGPAHCA